MAAPQKRQSRPADELPIIDPKEMNDAVELPTLIDPPQVLDLPAPEQPRPSATTKRVQILRTEMSVHAGGAHYTTQAGAIMELPQAVADDMIAQRVAKEI